jgi:hypothetical protein
MSVLCGRRRRPDEKREKVSGPGKKADLFDNYIIRRGVRAQHFFQGVWYILQSLWKERRKEQQFLPELWQEDQEQARAVQ